MAPWTLSDIEHVVRSAWDVETCTPEDSRNWHPGNPARDQCGATTLDLHDLLGGDLVRGEVHVSGKRTDFHRWNRLAGNIEVDLAREQFTPEEIVTAGSVIKPPATIVRLVVRR